MLLPDYFKTDGARRAIDIAAEIGASSSFISQWVTGRKPVPVVFMAKLEKATGGAVTRKEMRPLDYAEIWPELASPAPTCEVCRAA